MESIVSLFFGGRVPAEPYHQSRDRHCPHFWHAVLKRFAITVLGFTWFILENMAVKPHSTAGLKICPQGLLADKHYTTYPSVGSCQAGVTPLGPWYNLPGWGKAELDVTHCCCQCHSAGSPVLPCTIKPPILLAILKWRGGHRSYQEICQLQLSLPPILVQSWLQQSRKSSSGSWPHLITLKQLGQNMESLCWT